MSLKHTILFRALTPIFSMFDPDIIQALKPVSDALAVKDRELDRKSDRAATTGHTSRRTYWTFQASLQDSYWFTFLQLTAFPSCRWLVRRETHGEAMVVIGGVESKAHHLAMDLPQSDDCLVMAFPAETTEAFLEGLCSPSRARY